MRIRSRRWAAVLAVIPLISSGQTTPKYSIQGIGFMPGGESSAAVAVNRLGTAAGSACTTISFCTGHAVTFSGGALHDLGLTGGFPVTPSAASAVNDLGDTAGAVETGSAFGGTHGFYIKGGVVYRDFDFLPFALSAGFGMNNTGQVAGYFNADIYSPAQAFLRNNDGSYVSLGTLGGASSTAFAVGNAGVVVGSASTASGQTHAFLWTTALGMKDLGTLPGGAYSVAYAISSNGFVVGAADLPDPPGTIHAFFWRKGAPMIDLGGGPGSEAYGVNRFGQAVGVYTNSEGLRKAAMWVRGRLVELNTLIPPGSGWDLVDARAISDAGYIAGHGNHNGQTEGFLLTPIH